MQSTGTTAVSADHRVAEPRRSIPSLDGLRAFSILLVMVAHASWYWSQNVSTNLVFRSVVGNGRNGVAVFFVISGFLITTLLRREFEKTGTVSLKHFYFRRSIRIFPAFYVFLAVMAVLWAVNYIPEQWPSFLASLTYTYALDPHAQDGGYFIAHTWSLSIEELFYLFWPFAFLIWHRRDKAINSALFLILLMPLVRVGLYFAVPSQRGHENYMVQGWLDTMMVGCVIALLRGQAGWERLRRQYLNWWSATILAIVGFLVLPALQIYLPRSISGLYTLAIKPTVLAVCIGGLLVFLIESPDSIVGKLLNHPVIRHIGIISYSLYLWQQLFMSEKIGLLPYGFLFAFACAELSFWVVEQPSLRVRSRLERRFLA